jgi:hypothetical protein
MSSFGPVVLIEGILFLGGAIAFGWWQIRSVERDRREMLARREREAQEAARTAGQKADVPQPADTPEAAPSQADPASRP